MRKPREIDDYLNDILTAISDIETFTSGMTIESFIDDKKTYYAVIRCFEIIGEASSLIPQDVKENITNVPWRDMKTMRNLLIHEYFGINFTVIWHTIQDDLPSLKQVIQSLVSTTSPAD